MYSPPPSELLGLRIIFFIVSFIGLALTDFFYIATMINYAFQCQLIFCAINATVSRLSNRHVEVDDAVKVCNSMYNIILSCVIIGSQNTARFFEGTEWEIFITSIIAIICLHWRSNFKYVS